MERMLVLSREYVVHALSVFVIACAALYSLLAPAPATPVLDDAVGERVTIVGTIVREPDVREKFVQLTTKTDVGTVLVRVDQFTRVSYGDSI